MQIRYRVVVEVVEVVQNYFYGPRERYIVEPTITFMDMPALIEQQPIPEIEEHPYVGDSVGGVEYVSGFLSIKII